MLSLADWGIANYWGFVLAVLVFMGLQPALASQLWLSLLVAGGFAAAFWLLRAGRRT